MREGDIISAPNAESIYEIPLNFEKDNISKVICEKLKINPRKKISKNGKVLLITLKKRRNRLKSVSLENIFLPAILYYQIRIFQ